MKKDVIAEFKYIQQTILGNRPAFGNTRNGIQVAVNLYQPVKYLVDHPDGVLVACKSRVH